MQLTQEQLWYVERLADPTETRTHEELADELGLDRSTLWRWRQMKGFGELVYSVALTQMKSDLGKIFGVLVKAAMKGDTRSARIIFELSGLIQNQSARKLFNEEAYTDFPNNDDYVRKFIQLMEEGYTKEQRLVISRTLTKMFDDIDFIKLPFPAEKVTIGESVQMQVNSN